MWLLEITQKRSKSDISFHFISISSFSKNTVMHTYIKAPQQEQRGLQAYRKYQAQNGGGDERPDTMRLRQDDDNSQGDQHGHPQQGRQMWL